MSRPDYVQFSPEIINIFLCNNKLIADASLLRKYETMLSRSEYSRWQRLKCTKVKHNYLITRAMIRTILSTALRCELDEIELIVSDKGKPHLLHSNGWQFNLSHSHNVAVLAVAPDVELGVDIEYRLRKVRTLPIARSYFSTTEIALLESLTEIEANKQFFSLWTLKEAYLKALGSGLAGSLKSCRFLLNAQRTSIAISVDPSPHRRFVDCWQCEYEDRYSLAVTRLSDSETPSLIQAYHFIPEQHCSPLKLKKLCHGRLDCEDTNHAETAT